jgi:anti-sigma-K factor RskA
MMSKNHIISLIEGAPLASLSDSDLTAIRAHTDECLDCRRALEAAQISMLLLKERAAETFEPSPFFHTRVLATLRERQTTGGQWAWSKVWRAAGALASSMVATVAALAVLTFVIPGSQTNSGPQDMTSSLNAYSAEEVLLDQGDAFNDQVSEGQILRMLYGAEDEAAR